MSTSPDRKERGEGAEAERGEKERGERRERKVLEEEVFGKVKWFNVRAGFGFIEREDDGKDVFVHLTAIPFRYSNKEHWRRSLGEGESVVFSVVEGRKGQEAWTVMGPGGARLKGSDRALTKTEFIERAKKRRQERAEKKESGGEKDGEKGADGDVAKERRPRRRPRGVRRESDAKPEGGNGDGGKDASRNRNRRSRHKKDGDKKESGDEDRKDSGRRNAASDHSDNEVPAFDVKASLTAKIAALGLS